MTINFGSGFIRIPVSWTELKDIVQRKSIPVQYVTQEDTYCIFAIDSVLVYVSNIYTGTIPDGVTFTQVENDADKEDFENNFQTSANLPLSYRSSLGDTATAAAKGLGNFVPDPSNNPYQPSADERVSLYVDGEGSLVTRSNILTDEGSFRDEFSGTSLETVLTGDVTVLADSSIISGSGCLFTEELNREFYIRPVGYDSDSWKGIIRVPNNDLGQIEETYSIDISGSFEKTKWIARTEVSGAYTVTSSILSLTVDGSNGSSATVSRAGDYCPIYCKIKCQLSDRNNNQEAYLGFVNDITDQTIKILAYFSGTDNATIKFISSYSGIDEETEETDVVLPVGLTTAQFLQSGIYFNGPTANFTINDIVVAKHGNHLPNMYQDMELVAGIHNLDSTVSASLNIDTFFFSNQNKIEIANSFQEPIAVIVKEDLHTITAKLDTDTTTSDQIILSYTVPNNKIFYIVGYSFSASGTANAAPVKIGKNDISTEPVAPGEINSNLFRVFNWTVASIGTNVEVDYGSNPRKFAASGDVVKFAVTPDAALSTTWRVSLDFVLR